MTRGSGFTRLAAALSAALILPLLGAQAGCSSPPETPGDMGGVDQNTPDQGQPDLPPVVDHASPDLPDLIVTPDADGGADASDGPNLPPGVVGPFPLTTCDRLQYAVATTIGTQTFNLSIDTGSASLAVGAASCMSCSGVDPNGLYAPGESATDLMRTTTITYADGSGWKGEIYKDSVQLAGQASPINLNLVAIETSRRFLRPPTTCSDGSTYIDDGIIGLGPEGSGAPGTDDFITQMARNYPGIGKAFSFQLCDHGGNMWVGGYDPAYTAGPMQLVPMLPVSPNNNPFYSVEIGAMSVDGTDLGVGPNDFGAALVDSGTTLFYLGTPAFTALTNKLIADPTFSQMITSDMTFFTQMNCVDPAPSMSVDELNAALPKVRLTLPGHGGGMVNLDLPAFSSYLTRVDDGMGGLALCSGVQDGGGSTIMGDVVLSALVTLIDREVNLVGFAPQQGCQ
jgi:hypothetical protein